MIKDIFGYLDINNQTSINYSDFSQLSEENLSKNDIIDFTIASLNLKRRKAIKSALDSIKTSNHHQNESKQSQKLSI